MRVRPRKPENKGLPPNLYLGARGYYKYRHPMTGKDHGMGADRRKACEAARILNAQLCTSADLVSRVMGTERPFCDFLQEFEDKILPERDLSAATLRDYTNKLAVLRTEPWAKKAGDEITVGDIATFLDARPPTQGNHYRALLVLAFKYAIAKGHATVNPAAQTIKKAQKVQRQRLTLEGFKAVYASGDQILKNAMDLALHTLQRREDVVEMKRPTEGVIEVVQKKTGAAIRIKVAGPLKAVVARCNDGVASPYLLHQPVTANKRRRAKPLEPNSITRRFAKARDASRFFERMKPEERPTFHEIRALGAKLYEQAGVNPQTLLGHTTEAMTQVYLDRHELKWTSVEAGLVLEK